jgi:hypothetical protein
MSYTTLVHFTQHNNTIRTFIIIISLRHVSHVHSNITKEICATEEANPS